MTVPPRIGKPIELLPTMTIQQTAEFCLLHDCILTVSWRFRNGQPVPVVIAWPEGYEPASAVGATAEAASRG